MMKSDTCNDAFPHKSNGHQSRTRSRYISLLLILAVGAGCRSEKLTDLIGESRPEQAIANLRSVLASPEKYSGQFDELLDYRAFSSQPVPSQDILLYLVGVGGEARYCDALVAIAAHAEYFESACTYACPLEYAVYRCCGTKRIERAEALSKSTREQILGDIRPLASRVNEGEPEFALAQDRAEFQRLHQLDSPQLLQLLKDRQLRWEKREWAAMALAERNLDQGFLPTLIYVAATEVKDGAMLIQGDCQTAIANITRSEP